MVDGFFPLRNFGLCRVHALPNLGKLFGYFRVILLQIGYLGIGLAKVETPTSGRASGDQTRTKYAVSV